MGGPSGPRFSGAKVSSKSQLPVSPVRSTTMRPAGPASAVANDDAGSPPNLTRPGDPEMPQNGWPGAPNGGAPGRCAAATAAAQSCVDGFKPGPGPPPGRAITSA